MFLKLQNRVSIFVISVHEEKKNLKCATCDFTPYKEDLSYHITTLHDVRINGAIANFAICFKKR